MAKDLENSELYEGCYRTKEKRSNFRFLVIVVALVCAFLGFRFYWVNHYGGVQVDGSSMRKTLTSGQQLVMEYTSEKNKAQRGDIIIIQVDGYEEIQKLNEGKAENRKLKFLIKRLIAIEGDKVRCTDGQIEIQYVGTEVFVPLEEPYAYYPTQEKKAEYDFGEYTVGEGEVFFLGDNRTGSMDSRYNDEHGSHLKDKLYQEKDIVGFVPEWALKYQRVLEIIFFLKGKNGCNSL